MNPVAAQSPSQRSLILLSQLLLPPRSCILPNSPARVRLKQDLLNLDREGFEDLLILAQSNHVIVRGLKTFLSLADEEGDTVRAEWAESALATERVRIERALMFLHEICVAFEELEYGVTVIKSRDHWPDLGSRLLKVVD